MIKFWGTYDGRVVEMTTINHQHLSNIYHFVTTIVPELYDDSVRRDIMFWLKERFGNIILPYHPDPKFTQEKNYLRYRGFLKENDFIVVNNEVIGCY